MSPTEPVWWDADLLLGRDPATTARVSEDDLAAWLAQEDLGGGVLGSQRAIHFDAASGNAEVREVAAQLGLVPALTLETRDWLGARDHLAAAAKGTVVRLAPQRQDCQPTHPGFRAIVGAAIERGFTIFCEGDVRVWGPAFAGRGARVVFLDAHFYHLGDLVALTAEEPGFHASTRLLNGPDSLALVIAELEVERLVFGSRVGFHEAASAALRLTSAGLDPVSLAAIAGGNLRRLLGVEA